MLVLVELLSVFVLVCCGGGVGCGVDVGGGEVGVGDVGGVDGAGLPPPA